MIGVIVVGSIRFLAQHTVDARIHSKVFHDMSVELFDRIRFIRANATCDGSIGNRLERAPQRGKVGDTVTPGNTKA